MRRLGQTKIHGADTSARMYPEAPDDEGQPRIDLSVRPIAVQNGSRPKVVMFGRHLRAASLGLRQSRKKSADSVFGNIGGNHW